MSSFLNSFLIPCFYNQFFYLNDLKFIDAARRMDKKSDLRHERFIVNKLYKIIVNCLSTLFSWFWCQVTLHRRIGVLTSCLDFLSQASTVHKISYVE